MKYLAIINHNRDLKNSNPVFWLEEIASKLSWRGPAEWNASATRFSRLLDELARSGAPIPLAAVKRWMENGWIPELPRELSEPSPRVVGLGASSQNGLVVPIQTRVSSEWLVGRLPFDTGRLQDCLHLLFSSLELPGSSAIPERWAFRVQSPFKRELTGPSMDVAGVLSLIDAANESTPPLFSAACAVIAPGVGEQLVAVEKTEHKLAAFVREFGSGSLLVRPRDCRQSSQFDQHFRTVWPVQNWRELGELLQTAGALNPFLREIEIDRTSMRIACDRLRQLTQNRSRYRQALGLAERLLNCSMADDIPLHEWLPLRETTADLYRHNGRFRSALRTTGATMKLLQSRGDAISYDQHAKAAVDYAAGLFDPHRFGEACEILHSWVQRIESDPPVFSPPVRVAVWNTLARCLAAAKQNNWEPLFRQSLELHAKFDPSGMPRTQNYLIHALLICGRTDQARVELQKANAVKNIDPMSRWMLDFLQAKLAAWEGGVWQSDELERSKPAGETVGHPFGFYFQATARQSGRTREDIARRFQLAGEFFTSDIGSNSETNILHFLAQTMELAAAIARQDQRAWLARLDRLRATLAGEWASELRTRYESAVHAAAHRPTLKAIEALLRLIPHL